MIICIESVSGLIGHWDTDTPGWTDVTVGFSQCPGGCGLPQIQQSIWRSLIDMTYHQGRIPAGNVSQINELLIKMFSEADIV